MSDTGKAAGRIVGIAFLSMMGAAAGMVLGCGGAFTVVTLGDRHGWTLQGDAAVGFMFMAFAIGLSVGPAVGALVTGAVARMLICGGRNDGGPRPGAPLE